MFGPSFDKAAYQLGVSENEAPFTRAHFRQFRRLFPGSAPVLQQIMNSGERYTGTVFDWPDPK